MPRPSVGHTYLSWALRCFFGWRELCEGEREGRGREGGREGRREGGGKEGRGGGKEGGGREGGRDTSDAWFDRCPVLPYPI